MDIFKLKPDKNFLNIIQNPKSKSLLLHFFRILYRYYSDFDFNKFNTFYRKKIAIITFNTFFQMKCSFKSF